MKTLTGSFQVYFGHAEFIQLRAALASREMRLYNMGTEIKGAQGAQGARNICIHASNKITAAYHAALIAEEANHAAEAKRLDAEGKIPTDGHDSYFANYAEWVATLWASLSEDDKRDNELGTAAEYAKACDIHNNGVFQTSTISILGTDQRVIRVEYVG